MTNTTLLRSKIDDSGFKLSYVAKQIGLSRYGLMKKIENKNDFKAYEIAKLCDLLNISEKEMGDYFFYNEVD